MTNRAALLVSALATGLVAIVGCSHSSGGGSSSSVTAPPTAVAIKAANTAISGISGILPNTLSALMIESRSPNQMHAMTGTTSPHNIWTQGFLADPRCSGGGSDVHCSGPAATLQGFMGFMVNADAVRDNGSSINIFGRLKQAMSTACAVSSILSYTHGGTLPGAGTYSVTFDSTTSSILTDYCGMAASDVPPVGTTASVVLTATTDTTYYDYKVAVTVGGDSLVNYLRVNDSTMNIAEGEAGSRTWVALNRTTGVVRAEYASYSSDNGGAGEMHRLYYDTVNKVGAMVGSSYDFQGSPNRFIFALVGKPQTSGAEVALSIGIVGYGLTSVDSGASTSALNYYKSCVNPSNGAVTTDNSVACAGGVTGVDASGTLGGTVYTNYVAAVHNNAAGLTHPSVYGESASVGFTNTTDIFTTAVSIH